MVSKVTCGCLVAYMDLLTIPRGHLPCGTLLSFSDQKGSSSSHTQVFTRPRVFWFLISFRESKQLLQRLWNSTLTLGVASAGVSCASRRVVPLPLCLTFPGQVGQLNDLQKLPLPCQGAPLLESHLWLLVAASPGREDVFLHADRCFLRQGICILCLRSDKSPDLCFSDGL